MTIDASIIVDGDAMSSDLSLCLFMNLQGVELNDELQQMIKNRLIIILNILEVFQYVLIGGGTLAFLFFTAWYIIRKRQQNQVKPFDLH